MALFGDDFMVVTAGKEKEQKVLDKLKAKKKTVKKDVKLNKLPLEEQLRLIKEEVNKVLKPVYGSQVGVIRSRDELHQYIDRCIENGSIAVDTETNRSLDPITCILMGACIYTKNELAMYVPINHRDPQTKERLDWQCTEQDIKEEFDRLAENNVTVIFHNADFDYRVIYCTCNCSLPIDWDTMVGARLLNENEKAALKWQYMDKIDSSVGKYSIDTFFKEVEYADVDVETFSLYAATDALITYRLYEWQKAEFEKPENKTLYELFNRVEIPLVPAVSHMELDGMMIDKVYAQKLVDRYKDEVVKAEELIQEELLKLKPKIDAWRMSPAANKVEMKNGKPQKTLNEKLKDPIEVTSSTQLAILLYDVLKLPAVSKKSPRGTGEDVLSSLSKKYNLPIGDAILKKRGLDKLLGTYVEKIPAETHADDRIRASINPLQADTGRFSISNPSLQNIPSAHKEVRLMFKAPEGRVYVGGDFSQQEPRLLAALSGDKNMIDAYVNGRDLYATVASLVYGLPYEENKEFRPDGSLNPEGKQRRSNCKSIVLGLLYGRGTRSVAEQIGESYEEAQKLVDNFFGNFPTVKNWIEHNKQHARDYGYVEGIVGRRRRLPDIQLPPYTVEDLNAVEQVGFNPLLNTAGSMGKAEVNPLVEEYKQKLAKMDGARYVKQRQALEAEARANGIKITTNGGFIAQAERQSTNAIIQGSAATLTKLAMIDVYNDPVLKELDAHMLLCIHDEILTECPAENADKVADRLSYLMIEAAKPVCVVPMKCDCYQVKRWYLDEVMGNVAGAWSKDPTEEGRQHIYEKYDYISKEALDKMIDGTFDCKYDDIL